MATIAEQTSSEYLRIQNNRNTIRNKLVELGMAASTDTLDKLAAAIEGIINQGAISIAVKEGETVTIPAGFHNGGGTVVGVSGGGNYTLQAKIVTPTKKQQTATADSGYFGLSSVVIAAIPEAYQDVSGVTAAASDVLVGKILVLSDGTSAAGTMPNNGAVDKTIDAVSVSYTIPKGYHSGTGKVKLVVESKTVTPSKASQDITPTSGKVLSKVTVAPIPDKYQDVSGVTASAATVLDGFLFVDAAGVLQEGAMPNNGNVSLQINPMTQTSVDVPAGYASGGSVTVTDDLLKALKSI